MGKSFEQIMDELRQREANRRAGVTVVTNQDNGIVSYATGVLLYHPASIVGFVSRPARLSTTGGTPLKYFFSDRVDIQNSPGGGPLGRTSLEQPFSAKETDQLGMSISATYLGIGNPVVKFTLHSWGNATFSVSLEPRGNLLVGVGAPIGSASGHAVYVISFYDIPGER